MNRESLKKSREKNKYIPTIRNVIIASELRRRIVLDEDVFFNTNAVEDKLGGLAGAGMAD